MICDNCYEDAEHRVYPDDSAEFPAGPGIKLCHTSAGTYIHVLDDQPETVAKWTEWEAPFNRIRRKLLRTDSGMKLVQKREQKRDGEWKSYPKDSDGRWSDVNADFPEDGS